MVGEIVKVSSTAESGTDPYGAPLPAETIWNTVENVLVAPGSSKDVTGQIRPDGIEVVYELHFPKTFDESLAGRQVEVRGEVFDVIGDPKPYTLENTPTQWWMPVEVRAVSG